MGNPSTAVHICFAVLRTPVEENGESCECAATFSHCAAAAQISIEDGNGTPVLEIHFREM